MNIFSSSDPVVPRATPFSMCPFQLSLSSLPIRPSSRFLFSWASYHEIQSLCQHNNCPGVVRHRISPSLLFLGLLHLTLLLLFLVHPQSLSSVLAFQQAHRQSAAARTAPSLYSWSSCLRTRAFPLMSPLLLSFSSHHKHAQQSPVTSCAPPYFILLLSPPQHSSVVRCAS